MSCARDGERARCLLRPPRLPLRGQDFRGRHPPPRRHDEHLADTVIQAERSVAPALHAVGMPGWQIIAIALAAAVLAAVIAVLADHAVIRHRRPAHSVAALPAR